MHLNDGNPVELELDLAAEAATSSFTPAHGLGLQSSLNPTTQVRLLEVEIVHQLGREPEEEQVWPLTNSYFLKSLICPVASH